MGKMWTYVRNGLIFIIFLWLLLFILLFSLSSENDYDYFEHEEVQYPLVIAHRGERALAPENTLEAFRASKELGVDVLEYDVRITVDGHLVVIHDETVNRTTNGLVYIMT